VERLRELNRNSDWREILGKISVDKHQKDVELILRLFALFENLENYQRPMKDFLSASMKRNLNFDSDSAKKFEDLFTKVAARIVAELGKKPFIRRGPVNSAFLESVFVTLLRIGEPFTVDIRSRFEQLKTNSDFQATISQSTANEDVLRIRHKIAYQVFAS
jgi:hypothetical protein